MGILIGTRNFKFSTPSDPFAQIEESPEPPGRSEVPDAGARAAAVCRIVARLLNPSR